MGSETKQSDYTQKEEQEFISLLKAETKWLKNRVQELPLSHHSPLLCGYEAEGWIINNQGLPCALSDRLIQDISDTHITPELSKFNFEINGNPFEVNQNLPLHLQEDFHQYWKKCVSTADKYKGKIAFIGTYPDITQISFGMNEMFPQNRYKAINNRIKKLRKSPHIHIEGADTLQLKVSSIMREAETTSLQIHLQVNFFQAKDFYNASLIASPIMSALCANSPYVCGKDLWSDSRIPLFEQVIALKAIQGGHEVSRVSLGAGFVEECVSELFEQNLLHPVLLPEIQKKEKEKLQHLLFHNGTIWRWNRPIIEVDKANNPHFRIEHRAPSAGPTLVDMQANILFFIGLAHFIKKQIEGKNLPINFQTLEKDFYRSARLGFSAKMQWIDGKNHSIHDLLLEKLIPRVREELKELGLNCPRTDYLINDVIKHRVATRQNGSNWQKAFVCKFGKKFDKMMQTYWQNQEENTPVYKWST